MEPYWCSQKNSKVNLNTGKKILAKFRILYYYHATKLNVLGGEMESVPISVK